MNSLSIEKQLILLELNEINFDIAAKYLDSGVSLPALREIMSGRFITTEAERVYEQLEPWIQWPSVHTGKSYGEHKVFRLGDFVNSGEKQFFEKVENAGCRVGAISPMNASNRLVKPAYFIPDPWTQTPSDNSFFSKNIAAAVAQAVNDNSESKLSLRTLINLGLAFFVLVSPRRLIPMARYALSSFGKPWRKALFLDMFLYEVHKTLFKRKRPNFSTLFLNAGAHIQHHYFFSSPFVTSELQNPNWYIDPSEDPFLEMLIIYDEMLQDLIKLANTEVIIATGLSQKPFDHLKFYYRLNNHEKFLRDIGIAFSSVVPRMTRDFLITFVSAEQALAASDTLQKVMVNDDVKLFEEIDNRGSDLFLVLTYPNEITEETTISLGGWSARLDQYVTFVAIKNGEHQSKGFAYFSDGITEFAPASGSHVSKIHNTVLEYFGVSA